MYTPAAYRNDNRLAAFDFVAQYGFATLVANDGGSVASAHLPMIADSERNVLRGHLARANPYCELLDGVRHLAVFVGANAYVSPDWYGDAEQVPTWNYSAVHIAGASSIIREQDRIDALLEELSDHHERKRHDLRDGKIWKLAKLPEDKLKRMRAAIVAFEIMIEKIEYKSKLSQNKSASDVTAVIDKLSRGDENQRAVAAAMEKAQRRG